MSDSVAKKEDLSLSTSGANPIVLNEHLILIYTGMANQEQVQEVLENFFIDNDIVCDFKLIVVTNVAGLLGYSYLWVCDSEVFSKLVGSNEDEVLDPLFVHPADKPRHQVVEEYMREFGWEPPEELTLKAAERQLIERTDPDNYESRNEAAIDRSQKKKILQKMFIQSITTISKNSGLTLPPYKLTPEQKKHYLQQHTQKGIDVEVPDYLNFAGLTASNYPRDNEQYNQDVLMSHRVPDWITEEDLVNLFRPFVDDTTTEHRITINKREVLTTYPAVSIMPYSRGPYRRAYVYFDPKKGEARLINCVFRRTPIRKLMKDGKVEEYSLFFNHPKV